MKCTDAASGKERGNFHTIIFVLFRIPFDCNHYINQSICGHIFKIRFDKLLISDSIVALCQRLVENSVFCSKLSRIDFPGEGMQTCAYHPSSSW